MEVARDGEAIVVRLTKPEADRLNTIGLRVSIDTLRADMTKADTEFAGQLSNAIERVEARDLAAIDEEDKR